MSEKQLKDSGKTPLKKVRAGRFQISLWAFRKLFANGGKDSTIYLEQWVDVERACIQYSAYNRATGHFENQAIWCSLDDLRNLAKVVDKLNGEDESSPSPAEEEEEEEEGEDSSFSFVENSEEDDEDDSCSSFFDEDNEVDNEDNNEVIEFFPKVEEKSSTEKNDEVNKMRSMKLFNLIKHLKSVGFYHDTFDLEEEGVRGVLSDYGICDEFTEEELQELRKDLFEMAERNEIKEVMRFVDNSESVEGMKMVEMF